MLETRKGTHGRGVFTDAPIAAGQTILAFHGPLLHKAETTWKTLALQIGPDLYIGPSGGLDDLVNHSCVPNAWVWIDGSSAELRALRSIEKNEEVLFDYSATLDEDDFTMECLCGNRSCRGTIRDAKYLPEAVWQEYIRLGILPQYVRRRRGKAADFWRRGKAEQR
jgi:hypothetical protein